MLESCAFCKEPLCRIVRNHWSKIYCDQCLPVCVGYCSRICQISHWPTHKQNCRNFHWYGSPIDFQAVYYAVCTTFNHFESIKTRRCFIRGDTWGDLYQILFSTFVSRLRDEAEFEKKYNICGTSYFPNLTFGGFLNEAKRKGFLESWTIHQIEDACKEYEEYGAYTTTEPAFATEVDALTSAQPVHLKLLLERLIAIEVMGSSVVTDLTPETLDKWLSLTKDCPRATRLKYRDNFLTDHVIVNE